MNRDVFKKDVLFRAYLIPSRRADIATGVFLRVHTPGGNLRAGLGRDAAVFKPGDTYADSRTLFEIATTGLRRLIAVRSLSGPSSPFPSD
jgi:hypothetical protein